MVSTPMNQVIPLTSLQPRRSLTNEKFPIFRSEMLPTLLHKPLAREVGQPLLTLQSLKIDLI